MSSSRQAVLLISYSLSPLRKRRRATVISAKPAYCGGTSRPSFWKVSETSAMPVAGRDSLPAKITSSIARPRRCLALCSPIAQRIASTTLLLPQPLGPTTPVTPSSKEKTTRSANDLKPEISTRRIFIGPQDHHDRRPRTSLIRPPDRAGMRGPTHALAAAAAAAGMVGDPRGTGPRRAPHPPPVPPSARRSGPPARQRSLARRPGRQPPALRVHRRARVLRGARPRLAQRDLRQRSPGGRGAAPRWRRGADRRHPHPGRAAGKGAQPAAPGALDARGVADPGRGRRGGGRLAPLAARARPAHPLRGSAARAPGSRPLRRAAA